MNWDAIGAIAELLGAVGVIASLVYLARQIGHGQEQTRQNARALRTGSRQQIVESYRAWNRLLLDPETARAFARGLSLYPDMPFEERCVFVGLITDHGLFFQSAFALHESGHLPEVNYSTFLDYTAALMSTPGGAAWWHESSAALPGDIVCAVEARMSRGGLADPREMGSSRLDEPAV